LNILSLVKLRP